MVFLVSAIVGFAAAPLIAVGAKHLATPPESIRTKSMSRDLPMRMIGAVETLVGSALVVTRDHAAALAVAAAFALYVGFTMYLIEQKRGGAAQECGCSLFFRSGADSLTIARGLLFSAVSAVGLVVHLAGTATGWQAAPLILGAGAALVVHGTIEGLSRLRWLHEEGIAELTGAFGKSP